MVKFPQSIRELSCLEFSDAINALVLGAGVAEDLPIPDGSKYVIFSGTTDFYVKANATAAVPAADVTDGTASELNPTMRSLKDVTRLSIVSANGGIVTASFYGA